jgi:hemoglobin-like flavoprotein
MALDVELLRSSFNLVLEREPEITHRFYDHLFEKYPQARPLFGRNSRQQQEKMLAQALVAVVEHLEDADWLTRELGELGAKHVGYGVSEEMYGWVGDALLTTLGEVAGREWTPELRAAWTEAYGAIAALMQAGARRATPTAGGFPLR